ncbi:MAG: hypothetical protein Q8O67_19290 [Deltaproteobacteria bacterium]|nr:hypothetical protein [Deltaproteobacteria bacterium]
MSELDLLVVVVVVAAAVGWLVSRFRSGKPPPCHQTGAAVEAPPQVVLGASLQRGLQRARARNSEKRVNS